MKCSSIDDIKNGDIIQTGDGKIYIVMEDYDLGRKFGFNNTWFIWLEDNYDDNLHSEAGRKFDIAKVFRLIKMRDYQEGFIREYGIYCAILGMVELPSKTNEDILKYLEEEEHCELIYDDKSKIKKTLCLVNYEDGKEEKGVLCEAPYCYSFDMNEKVITERHGYKNRGVVTCYEKIENDKQLREFETLAKIVVQPYPKIVEVRKDVIWDNGDNE